MRLEPRFQIPDDPKEAVKALSERLRVLEDLVQKNTVAQTKVVNAEPSKPRDGLFAYADGTNWDPGYGSGLYQFQSGVWQPVSADRARTHLETVSGTNTAAYQLYRDVLDAEHHRWSIGLGGDEGASSGGELSFWSYDNVGGFLRRVLGLDRFTGEMLDVPGIQFSPPGAALSPTILKQKHFGQTACARFGALESTTARADMAFNCSWDSGTGQWNRDDVSKGASILVLSSANFPPESGLARLFTAPAGANPITWNQVYAFSSLGLDYPLQPRGIMYLSGTQGCNTGTWTAVWFGANAGLTGCTFSNNTRLYVPRDGTYLISFGLGFVVSAAGKIREAIVQKNGTTNLARVCTFSTSTTEQTQLSGSAIAVLSANDYLELYGYQDSGGTLNFTTGVGNTYLSVIKVA